MIWGSKIEEIDYILSGFMGEGLLLLIVEVGGDGEKGEGGKV